MYEVKWTYKNRIDNLVKQLEKVDKQFTEFGYFKEQGKHPENPHLTYAELMAIHEMRLPGDPMRRPVFQEALRVNGRKFKSNVLDSIKINIDKWALAKSSSPKPLLAEIAKHGIKMIKPVFGDKTLLRPNTPGVARSKGRNSPMIEFGYLKEALAYKTSLQKKISKGY